MESQLTVIIPFKNEGIEVYNTIQNITEKAGQELKIILINDGSDDGYNYKKIAQIFQAKYIKHKISKGVAASREHGISVCQTKYFLFLDAHMRVFTHNWVAIILNELQKDKRAVFCCPTVGLNPKGIPIRPGKRGLGVFLNMTDLSYNWNTTDLTPDKPVSEIPCIMGASYSSNITYWKSLRGLEGLRGYGYDEQFISIKAILEGGTCKIIKEITFGHIFRESPNVPYRVNHADIIFNQALFNRTFIPRK